MELATRYVYKIYEKKSFSVAAQELFISQPALSATVARLEKELGFRIFDRSTVPLSLTPEGRIYVDYLEELLESERIMQRRLKQLSDLTYGNLSIGGSSYISYHVLPYICKEFYQRYPGITLEFDLGNMGDANNLSNKLHQHELDLVFTYSDPSEDSYCIPLLRERLIIAMRRSVPGAEALREFAIPGERILSGNYSSDMEIEDLSVFSKIPFLCFEKGSLTQKRFEKMMEGNYASSPYTIHNARHSVVHYNMMRVGLGALFTIDLLISSADVTSNDFLYFVPKSSISYRTLYLRCAKEAEQTSIIKRFLEVATEVCASNIWRHKN